MRIFFYTFGLESGRERLMPWRTVLEAASNIAKGGLYETQVRDAAGITGDCLTEDDVVFYPVTWRMGLENLNFLSSLPAKKIAYVPGGVYPLDGALTLCRIAGLKTALPFLLEALVPHKFLIRKLKKAGFAAFVGQSELTSASAVKYGWPAASAFTAIPGMDTDMAQKDYSVMDTLGLSGKKFIIYSGAPASIRGSQMAIEAFDRIADKLADTRFVLLMREDNGSDFTDFEKRMAGVRHKDSFIVVRERMTYQQLGAFFSSAYAAVLPFILIPSEMPLTYFDMLSFGTPVISFENGGTTEYLKPALKIVPKRTVGSLAEAMLELCGNQEERNALSAAGIELMNNHPSWEESSRIWLKAIQQSA